MTDDDGRYRFITIKPGAYPWRNHDNAWRPAHIHLSVFGRAFTERLVTQMYFPGDPLFAYDPIYQSVRDPAAARAHDQLVRPGHDEARVGARLLLRRRARRQRRDTAGERVSLPRTPSQTVGPFFEFGLSSRPHSPSSSPPARPGAIRIEGRVLDGAGAPVPDGLVEIWQADADGRYDGGWGWGRCATDADGHFAFTTVKPGAVREPDGSTQAPHVTRALLRARPAEAGADAHLLPGRGRGQRRRPRAAGDRRRRRARDADRAAERRRAPTAST